MEKKRGGDYMEPNKELQFGGLKKDPDKETYYGGPNTKAGRIAKRADNKAGRIAARKAGKGAKQMMKDAGESNKYARTVGRKVKKTTKATSTHSRRNSTIGEKADKAKQIGKRFVNKQDNIKAKEAGKDKVQAARKMLKGGVKPGRKKAVAGAVVQGAAAGLQGIGKLTDAIAGKETKFGKIAGAVGQTAGAVGGMMGGIPGDPMGKAMSAVPSGVDAAATPTPAATPAAPQAAAPAATTAPTDPNAPKPMKKGGKKKKAKNGMMKYKAGGAKPDYLDMDKDGNKTESMKSALKDRRSSARNGKMKGEKKKPGRNVG